MLACARIGATHTVIFGGFSAEALADRNNDARRKLVITADGGWRRGKVVPLKANVDEALDEVADAWRSASSSNALAAGRRDEAGPRPLVARADGRRESADCPRRAARQPSIRSSSSTPAARPASPRASLHTTAGYLLGTLPDARKWVFDLQGRRHLLVHRRHRLGHRPQLHRLRPARQRRDGA